MSARLSVVLVGLWVVLCAASSSAATGHGQLLVDEIYSSGIDIGHIDKGPLLTRRIRQSSGLSPPISTTIEQNTINQNQQQQHHPPLTCHRCRSFEDGDRCTHLPANSSIFEKTCGPQATSCMVIYESIILPILPKCSQNDAQQHGSRWQCLKTNKQCIFTLQVKRFSYTENATSAVELWSIERNCSTKCEPGCLILGDRTKVKTQTTIKSLKLVEISILFLAALRLHLLLQRELVQYRKWRQQS